MKKKLHLVKTNNMPKKTPPPRATRDRIRECREWFNDRLRYYGGVLSTSDYITREKILRGDRPTLDEIERRMKRAS